MSRKKKAKQKDEPLVMKGEGPDRVVLGLGAYGVCGVRKGVFLLEADDERYCVTQYFYDDVKGSFKWRIKDDHGYTWYAAFSRQELVEKEGC